MRLNVFRMALSALLMIAITGAVLAGPPIQIRQKDGTRWRGELESVVDLTFMQQGIRVTTRGTLRKVEDLYLVLDAHEAGAIVTKTIFITDVVAVKTVSADEVKPVVDSARAKPTASTAQPEYDASKPGVFVLPLDGTVGLEFRHEEIEKIAEEADKYGPGQIIVLDIKSGGGLVLEMEEISKTLREVRKRHRFIAWVQEAISAACATAIHCDEIYFRTDGVAGSMTMFGGDRAVQGAELANWIEVARDMMSQGGRDERIAPAMIEDQAELSYDKDPVTGEVRFYPDLSGEFILSRKGENLTFNSTNAEHCGFSDGTADTEEQLATLLDLPEWNEINEYGRKIHEDWMKTVKLASTEIPRLIVRLNNTREPRDQVKLVKELIRWWDRAPNVCFASGLPPKEALEQQLRVLQRQISGGG